MQKEGGGGEGDGGEGEEEAPADDDVVVEGHDVGHETGGHPYACDIREGGRGYTQRGIVCRRKEEGEKETEGKEKKKLQPMMTL